MKTNPVAVARARAESATASRWTVVNGAPDREQLTALLAPIITGVEPELVIVFGSAARRSMTADSDVDILIVKQVDNLHELARQARRSLPDDHPPVDIVPATRQLLERRRREWLSQVYRPAVAEGIVTYENNRTIEYGTRRASDTLPQRDESETERMVRIFHYRREEAVEFLKKAQTDLSVVNSTDRTIEPEARCYSAQAATEKALKALLVAHECTVPGRHELGKVVEEIKKTGEALPEIATDERLKKLSEYAGPAQYPGWSGTTTAEDESEFCEIARTVYEHARKQISDILRART